MAYVSGEQKKRPTMNRREFLWLTTLSTAGVATGCATNPVTGSRQLMLMNENDEIALDQENSPHQFSSDYGAMLDRSLNDYMAMVGKDLAARSHRPDMPYSFRGVNATYVNAYAFPGGSIATTRGILLELENEAELAALLGHEIGHVNARHTASRMSKGILAQLGVAMVAIGLESSQEYKKWAPLAAGLGSVAAGALLAKYSRDDERQADDLGMNYMTKAGYSPGGMVGLMDVLRSMSKHKPNAIEMMFTSHPMSDERYATAVNASDTTYAFAKGYALNQERYMDYTASLRRIQGAIEEMQNGEKSMMQEQYPQAAGHFDTALNQAPRDYAGLVMMAKCQLAMDRHNDARRYAERAKNVYPSEPQAHHISGVAKMSRGDYGSAYEDFDSYEQMLPGNPNTIFFKGYTREKMQHKQAAAEEYYRYLQAVGEGEQAQHAYQRLVQWGYIKPQPQQ